MSFYASSTSLHVLPINKLLSSLPSSTNFLPVSAPATGNLTSYLFPSGASFPSIGCLNGTNSGSRPNCFNAVAWSQLMCSWHSLSPRIATTLVNGISSFFPVAGMPGSSHGTSLSWVKEKTNSSMTRSVPTVRETRESAVSSGLLKMKWCV